jgi:hypothetical protein
MTRRRTSALLKVLGVSRTGAFLIFLLVTCALAGPERTSVGAGDAFQQIVQSLALGYSDEAIAYEVDNLELTECLDDSSLKVIERQGAGPLALRAIEALRKRAASRPLPGQPPVILEPLLAASDEQALLHKMAAYASNYLHSLPDFLCTETTRFFLSGKPPSDLGKKTKFKSTAKWRLDQTITEDVGYYGAAEHHHTRLVDNVPDARPIQKLRNNYSRGEFGEVLGSTFDHASKAQFQWDHWENRGRHRVAVFSYAITRENSQYIVCCASTGAITVNGFRQTQMKSWASAYRGLLYADPDTGSIERFTLRNTDIPAWVDMDSAGNWIDYTEVNLNGQTYRLPAKAVHHTQVRNYQTRDEIVFSDYRKFSADSTITFK